MTSDGLTFLDASHIHFEDNIAPLGNEVSSGVLSFENVEDISGQLIVDSYFGQCYQRNFDTAEGIYGHSDELLDRLSSFANYGYLRVPFRKIPRRRVSSTLELGQCIAEIRKFEKDVVFRGQGREYFLRRSPEALKLLYGNTDEREPSLLASGLREGVDLESVHPSWMFLIQLFLHSHDHVAKLAISEFEVFHKIHGSYNLSLAASAIAQHYGMGTQGLDVSSDLKIALFFALNKVTQSEEWPVLYIFKSGHRFLYSIGELGFPMEMFVRPSRQKAVFLPTGWGMHINSAARHLIAAIYLDPSYSWEDLPEKDIVFPGPEADPFLKYLDGMCELELAEPIRSYIMSVET